MFDYIRTEIPLPSEPKPPNVEWFQTKDTPDGCFLENWAILADGRLKYFGVRYEDRSDPTLEGLAGVAGMMTSVPDPSRDKIYEDFHGDLEFGHYDGRTKEHWEYVARFSEGRCVRIWCKEHEKPPL
jgi:hypothetical protein